MSGHWGKPRISSGWLATISVVAVVAAMAVCLGVFNRSFTPSVPVTLTSERSGLVMEPNAKVKMRGVQVGRVATVSGGTDSVSIQLEIDPDQIPYIPANVEARIDATTVFGGKFVDLVYPSDPSSQRLSAGTVLKSSNVAVEVNTVFENLVDLIKQIDPAKLNAVLSALAEGLRGQGERIGQATSAANEVLLALNSRTDTIREDWRALRAVSDTYGAAAHDMLDILSASATTSVTVTNQAKQLDALLLGVVGLSQSGISVLGPSKDNLVKGVNLLEPTTSLLMKYNPQLGCLILGGNNALETLTDYAAGRNGKSIIMDAAVLLGDDPYRYPDNLPINAAKGGPGGKPGCGSLPDVRDNWPVRYLVTNSGFGTGMDVRPNPGIGFPGWANYFPVTRAVPEPPSIRYPGGPAPGPIPYPGAPPYGAPLYGPDGSPLYPGVPQPPTSASAGPPPPVTPSSP
ncbi:MCE-family protein MCE3A [Mycolicibacterium novocastrense]|uniref:MCE family protein n=1 Tax=Mycolicibacterium novocastrense TaxID=59813 RepID=UPI0007471799|nr:MCE family protein [Mycolicibacterium novocastrense]KUH66971.1 MCE-family protein MCE3A [Mycolicibacterium novocastrense]KUH71384.1 MCE-family protein MCE3A [Mycolicibacterium novocastrense]KUH74448.1 MCE-family protein MCE3A [Mycolicibacterium novocastrense]